MSMTNQHYDTLQISLQIIKEKDWDGIRHFTVLTLSSAFAAVMYFWPLLLEGTPRELRILEEIIFFPLLMCCFMGVLRRTDKSFQSSLTREGIPEDYKMDMKNYTVAMIIFQFSVMMSLLYSILHRAPDNYDDMFDCTRIGIALTIRSLSTLFLVRQVWKIGVLTDMMSMIYLVYFSLIDLYGALHIFLKDPKWYNFTDFEYTTLFRAHQIVSIPLMIQYCLHIDPIKDYQKGIFNLGSRIFVAVLITRSRCNGYQNRGEGFENEDLLFYLYLPILFLIGILKDRTFFLLASLTISLIGTISLALDIDQFHLFLQFIFSLGFTILIGTTIVNRSFVKTHAISLCKKLEAKAISLIGLNTERERGREDLNEPLIPVI